MIRGELRVRLRGFGDHNRRNRLMILWYIVEGEQNFILPQKQLRTQKNMLERNISLSILQISVKLRAKVKYLDVNNNNDYLFITITIQQIFMSQIRQ